MLSRRFQLLQQRMLYLEDNTQSLLLTRAGNLQQQTISAQGEGEAACCFPPINDAEKGEVLPGS